MSLKCLKNRLNNPSFGGAGSRFGPMAMSRLAASAVASPSRLLRNVFNTSSACNACGSLTVVEALEFRLTIFPSSPVPTSCDAPCRAPEPASTNFSFFPYDLKNDQGGVLLKPPGNRFWGVRGQAYGIALKQRFHRTLIVNALGNVDLILR